MKTFVTHHPIATLVALSLSAWALYKLIKWIHIELKDINEDLDDYRRYLRSLDDE